MKKVKAVSGATGKEFAALQKNARDLGSSTVFSASQVSTLQLEFAKLGLSSKEITSATESTFLTPSASATLFAHARAMSSAEARSWSYVTTPTSGSAQRRSTSTPLTASLISNSLCHRRRSAASRVGPEGMSVLAVALPAE